MHLKHTLPFRFAKSHGVLLDGARVIHKKTCSHETCVELQRTLSGPLSFESVSDADFEVLLFASYEAQTGYAREEAEKIGTVLDLTELASQLPSTEELLETQDDAPIIRLINAIVAEALKQGASDVHFESFENRMLVRYRIDGTLRRALSPDRGVAPLMISRIKVMAKLDIAEKRLPQDGRIALRVAGRALDIRVSTMPSSHGERVVMRLLDKQSQPCDWAHLGMPDTVLSHMQSLIKKSSGIILVTGPTGSGKTTTLYAALTALNASHCNILTVEDPIEYHVDGIGQTQVDPKIEMTFSKALRAILRQDPDVIMVGEIRDKETAQMAVQASLTGHLVLSTLHTNTAVGAITRLRHLGVAPFLLASSLMGIMAQRLVRILCPDCKVPYTPDQNMCDLLKISASVLYRAKGCTICQGSGYQGRVGIYELLIVNEAVREKILETATEAEILRLALLPSLAQDGIQKILSGVTSAEEVLRLVDVV